MFPELNIHAKPVASFILEWEQKVQKKTPFLQHNEDDSLGVNPLCEKSFSFFPPRSPSVNPTVLQPTRKKCLFCKSPFWSPDQTHFHCISVIEIFNAGTEPHAASSSPPPPLPSLCVSHVCCLLLPRLSSLASHLLLADPTSMWRWKITGWICTWPGKRRSREMMEVVAKVQLSVSFCSTSHPFHLLKAFLQLVPPCVNMNTESSVTMLFFGRGGRWHEM